MLAFMWVLVLLAGEHVRRALGVLVETGAVREVELHRAGRERHPGGAGQAQPVLDVGLGAIGVQMLEPVLHRYTLRQRRIELQVLLDVRQPISAVFYQSASMAGRAKAFLDFLAGRLVL